MLTWRRREWEAGRDGTVSDEGDLELGGTSGGEEYLELGGSKCDKEDFRAGRGR